MPDRTNKNLMEERKCNLEKKNLMEATFNKLDLKIFYIYKKGSFGLGSKAITQAEDTT